MPSLPKRGIFSACRLYTIVSARNTEVILKILHDNLYHISEAYKTRSLGFAEKLPEKRRFSLLSADHAPIELVFSESAA